MTKITSHPGVTWDRTKRKWLARGQRDGQRAYLGAFDTQAAAIAARSLWLAVHTNQQCSCGAPVAGRRSDAGRCVDCARRAGQAATKRWEQADPERYHDSRRRSRSKHLETAREGDRRRALTYSAAYPDRRAVSQAVWHAANPGLAAERARDWYAVNTERAKAAVNAWRAAHPDAVSEIGNRRRVRLLAGDVRVVTRRDWLRMLERFHHRCAYCNVRRPLGKDHIIPVSRGGRHSIGNLLPACRSCNSRKHDRLLVEWRYRS